MKKIILSATILILVFVACKKTNTLPDRFTVIPETNTNVKFLNLSPGSPQLNFFTADVKTTAFAATSTGVVTGFGYNGFFPSTIGYATIPSGSIKIDAKVTDASTVMPGAIVLSTTQTFDAKKFYTFVLLDTITKATSLVVEDDPTVPDQTKSYLRIANFISDSAVNVEVTKTSAGYAYSKTYTNVAAKTVLQFDSLGAGSGQVYKIVIKRASNDAILFTLINFAPSQTKKYTFYTRGLMRLTLPNAYAPNVGLYANF